jgi:hypothetical protein
MKSIANVGLTDVNAVYDGAEGDLWELIMGRTVLCAEDTERFAPYVDLYLNMIDMQLTYDAPRIIGFDMGLMGTLAGDFALLRELAHAGKVAQGRFIARRN